MKNKKNDINNMKFDESSLQVVSPEISIVEIQNFDKSQNDMIISDNIEQNNIVVGKRSVKSKVVKNTFLSNIDTIVESKNSENEFKNTSLDENNLATTPEVIKVDKTAPLKIQLDQLLKYANVSDKEQLTKERAHKLRQKKNARAEISKKKNKQIVDFISGIFVFLMFLALGCFFGMYYIQDKINIPNNSEMEKTIIIPKDYGIESIAKLLQKNKVIDNTIIFQAAVYLKGKSSALKAGEYLIPAKSSINTMIDLFSEGKIVQHSVTLPEGLTSLQIVEKLKEFDFLSGNIQTIPSEGSLLPNTFNFPRGTTRQQVIERLQAAHKKNLDEVWLKRDADLPIKTKEELVILASIVEKETGISSERPVVAAVFINRLRKGMRLQSDPTIIYGIVGGKGALGRSLTRSDIITKTNFNTYTISGLPPTPIANVGRSALEAVANPAKTNALYFVADGSGGHVFAETLEEHNTNVSKWREIEKNINTSIIENGSEVLQQ